MQPLYKISEEYVTVLNALSEMDLTDTPEDLIENTLASIQTDFKEKAINVAAFIKNLEAQAKQIELAEKAMKGRKENFNKKIEGLKSYLLHNMIVTGNDKIFSPEFDIKIGDCPASVFIEDIKKVPEEFMRIPNMVAQPDKVKLKEAIENGLVIEGVVLVKNKRLSIK